MPDPPLTLNEADFADDVPPGFLSNEGKHRYTVWMVSWLVLFAIVQIAVPLAVGMVTGWMAAQQSMTWRFPQTTRLVAWQDRLWYPVLENSGSSLHALDEAGQPAAVPPIPLPIQPNWLVVDGERLWAISGEEVAEIHADGSRPVVMFPREHLTFVECVFLHQGRPALVESIEDAPPVVKVFEAGEWVTLGPLGLLKLPMSEDELPEEEEAPADATQPSVAMTEEELLGADPSEFRIPYASLNIVRIAENAGTLHTVQDYGDLLYHYRGLPMQDKSAEPDPAAFTPLPFTVEHEHWTLTSVGGELTLVTFGSTEIKTWGYSNEEWRFRASYRFPKMLEIEDITAVMTADGRRTLAACNATGETHAQLFELLPDRIEKLGEFGRTRDLAPKTLVEQPWMQWTLSVITYGGLLVMVLASAWLMHRYRTKQYYFGRTPVLYASNLRRGFAVGIDSLICWGPVYLYWYLWSWQSQMTVTEFAELAEINPGEAFEFLATLVPMMLGSLAWILVCEIFEWLLLSRFGCTAGKFLAGVRVMQTTLHPPGLIRGLARNLTSWIELPIFSGIVGIALVAFTQHRQRLADLVAGTVVLQARSLHAARQQLQRDSD